MDNIIESVKNQRIKDLVRLHNKKGRDEQGLFLIEGIHLIEEAQAAGLLKEIFALKDDTGVKNKFSVPVTYCSQAVLNKLSQLKSDAKLIGLAQEKPVSPLLKNKVLILDRIQDPGNLGTLIRSAFAFGIQQVILSLDCADIYSSKVIQSSQGAIFHIDILRSELSRIIPALKNNEVTVYGAALDDRALSLRDVIPPKKWGIIIGNEGQGISSEVLELCDQKIKIEMKNFESLNAAVAGSILMYWFLVHE